MNAPRKRLSLPLRLALVAGIALATAGTLLALLIATDTALSIGQRLADAPAWLVVLVGAIFATLAGASAWLVHRLLRRPAPVAPSAREPATREAVETRAERIAARTGAGDAKRELAELDRRAAAGELHVALFGEISAGKTALLRALVSGCATAEADGPARLASDVRGGTTREVVHVRGRSPGGRELVLADMPGLNEAGGGERDALARAEAVRAHALVYVSDADL